MASSVLVTTGSNSIGNIYSKIQIRQSLSVASGEVVLQARLIISWATYQERDYTFSMVIYRNNAYGTRLLNCVNGSEYNTSWHRTYAAGEFTSEWFDLSAIENTPSATLYAVVRPNIGAGTQADLTYTFEVEGIKRTYDLTTTSGVGSSVIVSRQASNVSDTGNLSSGAILYEDDTLRITATPGQNYRISQLNVNGESFVSGDSYIVSGAVIVSATAQILASDVGASNADIESVSTITIMRYGVSYVHSLQYSFGTLSGYITENGGVSASEVRLTGTSIAFTVPASFYSEIPNSVSGVCTITCRTYESATSTEVLGQATTCTFTATASQSVCSPTVSGAVEDTNTTTIALTGDPNTLVRFLSTAKCTITASAKAGASMVSKAINGNTVTGDYITITGDNIINPAIIFTAEDSRGFKASTTVNATMLPYVMLTINPIFYRPSPTSGEVSLTFNGAMYAGNWRDSTANQISIRYRYRESGTNIYSSWISISSGFVIQSSKYSTSAAIALSDAGGSTTGFDYRKSYVFQIEVCDGDGTTVCQTVTREATVQSGIPVFDWGENDFRFNVPIKIGNTQLTEEQLISLLALLS